MSFKAKTPQDMIADDASYAEKDGVKIRKGSMAAILANAEIVEASNATQQEKQQALNVIKELAPALKAIGLTKFVRWNNPQIQQIFDQIDD